MTNKTTGFASPSQGYEAKSIDFNRLLIQNPASTFIFRLETGDLAAYGVASGSWLIVDRSLDPAPNSLVIIRHEGHFYCRFMVENNGKTEFTSGNETIRPTADDTAIIGVVTTAITAFTTPKEINNDL
jgi:DNA polymerase V